MLQDTTDKLQTLVSDSFKQQQDLDRISDDLGSLKFGFALLQEDNHKQFQQYQRLININQKLLWQFQRKIETLENIEGLVHPCGGSGWRRVVHLDMNDYDQNCPPGWQQENGYPERSCSRINNGESMCDSVLFPVTGGEYSRVCGWARGFQFGLASAFLRSNTDGQDIDGAYVHGLSLTRGSATREHIWTFAVGLSENNPNQISVCPCDTDQDLPVPEFVGNDYFCESGIKETVGRGFPKQFENDRLWDGQDCLGKSECRAVSPPFYFVQDLETATCDSIEARLCYGYGPSENSDIAIQVIEIYVHE